MRSKMMSKLPYLGGVGSDVPVDRGLCELHLQHHSAALQVEPRPVYGFRVRMWISNATSARRDHFSTKPLAEHREKSPRLVSSRR